VSLTVLTLQTIQSVHLHAGFTVVKFSSTTFPASLFCWC